MSLPKKKKPSLLPEPQKRPKVEPPTPVIDKYIAGTVPTPHWEPTDKDWELLAAMFRGR